jgi:uncharacterized protein
VLDSFALLAYFTDEPAAERVEQVFLSIINLGEILYTVERRGGVSKAQQALALVRQLPIEILPAGEQAVFAAAHIQATLTLSYAGAFTLAAAVRQNALILTGDPEFKRLEKVAKVEWLGK